LLVLGGVKLRYALAHRGLPGSNVSAPDFVTVDYLPLNEYSRPGTPLREISGVVVHYVGNPGTSAAANRSFFANLALTLETYASAHFVVGLKGEILQCVPLTEIAYCSNTANDYTVSDDDDDVRRRRRRDDDDDDVVVGRSSVGRPVVGRSYGYRLPFPFRYRYRYRTGTVPYRTVPVPVHRNR